jgi:hypothetical protein
VWLSNFKVELDVPPRPYARTQTKTNDGEYYRMNNHAMLGQRGNVIQQLVLNCAN